MPDTLLMGNAIHDLTECATFEGFVHVESSFCSCTACDSARRTQVASFAATWIAQHSVSESEEQDEQSGVQTIRPPAMSGSYPVRLRVRAA